MTTEPEFQTAEHEKTIISIMRRLPSERLSALIEFARFLEFQAKQSAPEISDEGTEPIEGDAKWDALLAKPKATLLLREMAQAARTEYAAGETTEINVGEDGRLKPL